MRKCIEIYYDNMTVVGKGGTWFSALRALRYRNAAIKVVERAMTAPRAGEWTGAEVGTDEVNFGFEVEDFERAESVVREAVRGTRFDKIREIRRSEFDEAAFLSQVA